MARTHSRSRRRRTSATAVPGTRTSPSSRGISMSQNWQQPQQPGGYPQQPGGYPQQPAAAAARLRRPAGAAQQPQPGAPPAAVRAAASRRPRRRWAARATRSPPSAPPSWPLWSARWRYAFLLSALADTDSQSRQRSRSSATPVSALGALVGLVVAKLGGRNAGAVGGRRGAGASPPCSSASCTATRMITARRDLGNYVDKNSAASARRRRPRPRSSSRASTTIFFGARLSATCSTAGRKTPTR